jgi:hypothetical protein
MAPAARTRGAQEVLVPLVPERVGLVIRNLDLSTVVLMDADPVGEIGT